MMSARLKFETPLLNEELLLNALKNLQIEYEIENNKIILSEYLLYRETFIEKDINGKYVFRYESELKTVLEKLIKSIQLEYKKVAKMKKLKEEEEAKKEYVKKRKEEIISKAKIEGYTVKEIRKENKVHLILQRIV